MGEGVSQYARDGSVLRIFFRIWEKDPKDLP
jgi:hypothetical protein